MSAALRLGDRALLRICDPSIEETMTVRIAYERFRVPSLVGKSASHSNASALTLERWESFEQRLKELGQRIIYPLSLRDLTSAHLQAFATWLGDTTCLGPDVINKSAQEILAIVKLASDNGHEIRPLRYKRLPKPVAAKIFFDALQIARLWLAAGEMDWPKKVCTRRKDGFPGTGLEPSVFWRSILVLMRTYGMRTQELVGYQKGKKPLTWRAITFDLQSPNPRAKGKENCQCEYGWLSFRSAKRGKQLYLPLTKYSRAAINRLHTAASARAASLGLDTIPLDWPLLPCPKGRLTDQFRKLTIAADVVRNVDVLSIEEVSEGIWRATTTVSSIKKESKEEAETWAANENYFDLEHFRNTAGTEYAAINPSFANRVCGWSEGYRANTAQTHYQLDEPTLLTFLPTAPMPKCFDDWLEERFTI